MSHSNNTQASLWQRGTPVAPPVVLLLTSLLIVSRWSYFLTDAFVASVDLPAHIDLVRKLANQLQYVRIFFYDPEMLGGWSAFRYYGPLPHIAAALFSFVLRPLTGEPERLAVHMLCVGGLALIPWSLYAAARTFLADGERYNVWLAGASAAVSFWFLNHDRQWYGIGAASILHIGLYAQLFGWHFLLLFIGALNSLGVESRKRWLMAALWLAMLILAHPLSAAFAGILGLCFFAFNNSLRLQILYVLVTAFAATIWWTYPIITESGNYLALDIQAPRGDLLELMLRYPIVALIQGMMQGPWRYDPMTLVLVMGAISFFTVGVVRSGRLAVSFLILCGLSILLSSSFIARVIGLGLHYYRFNGLLFLAFLPILAALPAVVLQHGKRVLSTCMLLLLGGSFVFNVVHPHAEIAAVKASVGGLALHDEKAVLEKLNSLPPKMRIWVEYADDYETFPFLSAHFITSELAREGGVETASGLFIQSSLAYVFPQGVSALLGGNTYRVPEVWTEGASRTKEELLQSLKKLGITHVVSHSEALREFLRTGGVEPPVSIGAYTITAISNEPVRVTSLREEPIAYRDEQGSLPFKFIEYFFFSERALAERYVPIELSPADELPPNIRLISNGKSSEVSGAIELDFPGVRQHQVAHDSAKLNLDRERYRAVKDYLTRLGITKRLSDFPSRVRNADESKPVLHWSSESQEFHLTGTLPGVWYQIPYGYAPYARAEGGRLFRGGAEQMVLLAEASEVRILMHR